MGLIIFGVILLIALGAVLLKRKLFDNKDNQ